MKALLLDRRFLPADGEFGLDFVSFKQVISTRKVVLKLLKFVGFFCFSPKLESADEET